MAPEPVDRAAPSPAYQRLAGDLAAPLGLTAALILALTGAIGYPTAVAVAAVVGAAVNGTRLIRLALAIHSRSRTFGPCRGAGFLGLGVVCSAGTALASAVLASSVLASSVLAGSGYARPTVVAAAGGSAVAGMYLLGLLLLPGAAPTLAARLRRLLDGLGLATSLLLIGWLLVIAPRSRVTPAIGLAPVGIGGLQLAVVLFTAAAVAVAVVTGLGAARYRRAALACGGGASAGIVGLAALAIGLSTVGGPGWLLVAAAGLTAGPLLLATGARAAGSGPVEPIPVDVDGTFAGYPLLLVPLVGAVVAAGYHVVVAGRFDRTAMALGLTAVAAVILREGLAIGDIRRYARRLAAQQARFRSIAAGSTDVTFMIDTDLTVRWQSPAAARLFGLSDQDVLGRMFTTLVHPDDAERVRERLTSTRPTSGPSPDAGPDAGPGLRLRLRDGFGQWRDTESTIADERQVPHINALVLHLRDVAERTRLERVVDRLAWTDQLTGLANRDRLLRATRERLGADAADGVGAGRPGADGVGAVITVELAGFGSVNSLRGHEIGDAVLVEAARRLREAVGGHDLAARLGPAEFAVLTMAGPVRAYALATRLINALTTPYELPGNTVHLSANAGLAELSGADGPEDVLRRAGLALRRARQLGRRRVECFDESIELALTRRLSIEQELPGAIQRGELDLVYQPVLELAMRRPVGVEALLRWRHPGLGLVQPAELIPVAEELGLADQVGDWVLDHACRQLSAWTRDGRDVWMGINTAPRQLAAEDSLARVAAALDSHAVPADRVVLEVAEQALDDAGVLTSRLAGLRALGVRTAIDHFGTGPTTLAHIRRLPVDMLKVDRAMFSEPSDQQAPAAPLLDVVVEVGRRLGIDIVATGLESPAHLDTARLAGCRFGQGHLLGRPGHGEHVEAFLESHRTPLL